MQIPDCIGPYKVGPLLGSGVIGSVYQGMCEVNTPDGVVIDTVAIKIPNSDIEGAVELLRHEFAIGRHMHHVHLVGARELILLDQHIPCMVMECVEGRLLEALVSKVELLQALEIVRQVAVGLDWFHTRCDGTTPLRGVHNDVKTANVFIATDGLVRLFDYNIADHTYRNRRMGTGITQGTPVNMSPEQARDLEIDFHSDLFALGTLLYQLVFNRFPFYERTTQETLTMIAFGDSRPLVEQVLASYPGFPDLANLLNRCWMKDPYRRPKSAMDVAFTLEAIRGQVQEHMGLPCAPVSLLPLLANSTT